MTDALDRGEIAALEVTKAFALVRHDESRVLTTHLAPVIVE